MKKLAVVSGASKGIGRAVVEKFAAEGFEVAVCSRSMTNLEALKNELESTYSTKIHVFVADVSKKEQIQNFGKFILDLQTPIHVMVNNAGLFLPGKILQEAEDTLEKLINTNVYSAYYLSRILVPEMETLESAHVFNICSIASLMAYPQSGSYSISKFALLGFSKSLRQELLETTVKVTSIMPGATLTDSWAGVDLPAERFMEAKDVADIIWASYNLSKSAVVEEIVLRPLKGDI
ncbi:SDR family oxidoreductase [Lacihabitans soyangensis]|uniref:SDR family NAD(P)-dependent oxidoreductase n=1 Tax=Lacihabitans soyangensis TaxID=869394 RepID=A0AAE3H5Q4_9BACT|nr:SDR family NAD(P)-dependent oxidoreductase [Lacihabitans soyangensis]MCP9765388.1 SDR family NAD(P)-dependent oxidoreductase [Lacihabitans soyangensis]